MTVRTSLLEDAVEDAIMSMAENNEVVPGKLEITYPAEEYKLIEKFHRFRVLESGKRGFTKDTWPFIRLHVLGIDVTISPEVEYKTIH